MAGSVFALLAFPVTSAAFPSLISSPTVYNLEDGMKWMHTPPIYIYIYIDTHTQHLLLLLHLLALPQAASIHPHLSPPSGFQQLSQQYQRIKMPTIILKVDLECCRCYAKIQKVLTRIQEKGEFCIEKIEYDEKNNKVIVSGPFDADKLSCKLCCKACKIIKEIEIVEPPPPPPPPPKEKPPPPPPKEEPPPPPPPKEEPPPPPKEEPPPPPKEEPPPPKPVAPEPPPPPKYVEIPFPYPYPYPVWPSECCWKPCPCYDHHGHGGCRCCSCGKAYEEPAPQQAPPQAVSYAPPPTSWPCSGAGYKIVCEEDPSYACSIM